MKLQDLISGILDEKKAVDDLDIDHIEPEHKPSDIGDAQSAANLSAALGIPTPKDPVSDIRDKVKNKKLPMSAFSKLRKVVREDVESTLEESSILNERYSADAHKAAHNAIMALDPEHHIRKAYEAGGEDFQKKLRNHYNYIERHGADPDKAEKVHRRKMQAYNMVSKFHGFTPVKLDKYNDMVASEKPKGKRKIKESIEVEYDTELMEGVKHFFGGIVKTLKPQDGETIKDVLKDTFPAHEIPSVISNIAKKAVKGIKVGIEHVANPVKAANARYGDK